MTATAYKGVLQTAVKKGKAVKNQVLEEIAIEEEVKKEHEIQKEVDKRVQEGELGHTKFPYGNDPNNPITMVRNPEDEVYGNLPMPFKVDIGDAVNFIEAWEGAKVGDMKSAFMESHLTNKVKDEYFDELRKRLEVAKREGHPQIIMPTPTQEMNEEMGDRKVNGDKENDTNLAATLAPLFTLQKIMGDNDSKETQEKPTEIVKTIMETAKGISEGKSEQEKPTDIVKGILETAKELSANQNPNTSGAINPLELTNTILATAEALSQSKHPTETQQNPDILQQITAVSELINVLSKKGNGESSESKIQVPREDGSVMEMTVQQYMLSEMLRNKLASAQQPQQTQDQKPQSDTIQIQDPDGTVRTMPATTYISELALKKMGERGEERAKSPSEAERVSQDSTKLMAALVATVERLSTEVSHLKSQSSKSDDPIQMMDTMLAQGEKIDNFRRRFLGGGLTAEDKTREQEEVEMQRAHELTLAKMQAQQANRSALTNILAGDEHTGLTTHDGTPDNQNDAPQAEGLKNSVYEKETIRESQRKAERMIEGLARERALAEKIAEERASRPKVRQQPKPQIEQSALEEVSQKEERAVRAADANARAKSKPEEKVKPKAKVRAKGKE
jgi:hypothetical protein